MKPGHTTLTVPATRDLRDMVHVASAREGLRMAEWIRRAIWDRLERRAGMDTETETETKGEE